MTNDTDSVAEKVFEISRKFSASAEQVFDAWLDPGGVGRWLFASADGEMKRVEVDPRVGGKFVISDQRGDTLAEHFGTYLEIDKPHRLVFSYAMDLKAEPTVVTIEILEMEDGCQLLLSHRIDPEWGDVLAQINEGWTSILESLATMLNAE